MYDYIADVCVLIYIYICQNPRYIGLLSPMNLPVEVDVHI